MPGWFSREEELRKPGGLERAGKDDPKLARRH